MKKRLMVGLLSAGLLAAMLPGVVAADNSWVCVGYHADVPNTGKIIVPTGAYCGLNPDSPVTGTIEVGGSSAMVRIFGGVQMMGKITVVEPGGQVNLNGGSRMYGKIECEYPGLLWFYSGAVHLGKVEGCTILYR